VNKRNVVKSGLEENTPGKHANWISKYGSVSFSLICNQHVWAGMNEKGLVISTMALSETEVPENDDRPTLSSGYWLQYILDVCSTVEEVIETNNEIRMGETVDHYLVSDRYGNSVVIEWLDGKRIYYTGNSLPVKCLTNNPYEELVDGWKKNARLEFKKNRYYKGSEYRFRLAADRVSRFQSTTTEKAIEYGFKTLQVVAGSYTQWSIIFDTEALQIHFHTKTHPQIRRVNMAELDFSCQTPILMLDIHEKLTGDITSELRIYDSDYHIDYHYHALRRWGSELDRQTVTHITKFYESYPCLDK
jgi:choloylglycine hydrolase